LGGHRTTNYEKRFHIRKIGLNVEEYIWKTIMLTKPIPSTGEALPVIGLGTYRAFNTSLNPSKKKDLQQVVNLFFAAGGSLIDSSPMYGKAEAVTGDVLDSVNGHDKAFLATKVWTDGKQNGIEEMDDSMRKMRCTEIDLMQVHNLVDCDAHLATLRDWQEAEKVKYIGITHYTENAFDELGSYLKKYPEIDFCQFPYSIARRDAEDYFFDLCQDLQVATLINRPFEQDGLFAKIKRSNVPNWANEFGCTTWAQFFLKYIFGQAGATCAIPATSNPDHMADNLIAGEGRLPDAGELKKMVEYFDGL
jgi:diketogulonate reductase-like aldo/keto reductase